MSKQLALAITFSTLATVALVLFGVEPAFRASTGSGGPSLISVEASPLPALSQLLPGRY